MTKIGPYLKQHRKAQRVTQKQVSDKIGLDSGQSISNIERGLCSPAIFHLNTWAELIKADKDTIVMLLLEDYEARIRAVMEKDKQLEGDKK